jgi:ADP-heptose:LPS heptosyltransferase
LTLGDLLKGFPNTAYALSKMDLVITVDTVLAHLAGAMGIPTFLLLSFIPDWRWMLGREDSPWYPTVRLYRQFVPGDWGSVVLKVLSDLMAEE